MCVVNQNFALGHDSQNSYFIQKYAIIFFLKLLNVSNFNFEEW